MTAKGRVKGRPAGTNTFAPSGLPREEAIAGMLDHIGLKLSFAANTFLELYRARLSEIDLTPSRVLALSIVESDPGLGQKSLARALSINQASAMAAVNRLEASGFVRREPGSDKRSKALFVTTKGAAAFRRALKIERQLSLELLEALSGGEKDRLAGMLDKIRVQGAVIAGR